MNLLAKPVSAACTKINQWKFETVGNILMFRFEPGNQGSVKGSSTGISQSWKKGFAVTAELGVSENQRTEREILVTCSVFSTFLYLVYFLSHSLVNCNVLPAILISLSFYYPTHPPSFLFLSFSFTLTFLLIYL